MSEEDCWALVGKKGKIIKKSLHSSNDQASVQVRAPMPLKQAKRVIGEKESKFDQQKEFMDEIKQEIEKLIQKMIEEIKETSITDFYFITYGIGRIFQSSVSQYQVAFLKLLKNIIAQIFSDLEITWKIHLEIFDPVFREPEKQYLNSLGFTVLSTNENCNRVIDNHQIGLFFMPHGEKFMYSNLIESNQSHLQRIYIIGNSFHHYNESTITKKKRKEIRTILNILDNIVEIPFPDTSKFLPYDTFNNTSIIYFTK